MNRKKKEILEDKSSSRLEEKIDSIQFQNHLKEVWTTTPADELEDRALKKQLWKKISQNVNHHSSRKYIIKYIGYAASVALIIMALNFSYWIYKEPQITNIYRVGRQTTDVTYLPDGSKVVLGAGSRISYPSDFESSNRKVELSGQAFFYVQKMHDKPFIVKTNKVEINVLGTEFEVFSYDEEKTAEVVLVNGSVSVSSNDLNINLIPNQRLSVNENNQAIIDTIDANRYTMWRDRGTLSFINESLDNIIPRLEKWYGKALKCDPKIASKYRFTFTIHDETFKELLEVMTYSSKLNFEEHPDGYYITY